jgi:hypothetical protein
LARTGKPAKQIQALLCSLDFFGSFCIKAERTRKAERIVAEARTTKTFKVFETLKVLS